MKIKNYYLLVLFFIYGCGGGGGGDATPGTPSTPIPTVNLSADPTSVLLNGTSTLTWSSSNTSTCSASWTTQTGTSGSEVVTISGAGNNNFSISCSGDGGTRSASVSVEGYRNTDGVVVDGYISGAEVCIDEDESWTCDSSENSTTSDNDGKFTIKYANGSLVSIGGTDLDSQTLLDNLLITHKLSGHSDFKAVTPVTSVAAFMTDSSAVNAALGIDSSIDVFTFDPVFNKGDGGINDYLYEKGNQLTVLAYALQNITNNLNTTTETTQDYFKAITEEIEKEYTETETKVDIETEVFVTKALDNVIAAKSVTIDETAKTNTTKALANVLPIIKVKSSNDLTTSIIRFAVSTLQDDIQAIANGSSSTETVTSYTGDIYNYIANDQNIDVNEIIPSVTAVADAASTSQDIAVTINVLANDSYQSSLPISLSSENGLFGTTVIAESSPEKIVYTPNTNFTGTDTFTYTITQGNKSSNANVTVTVNQVQGQYVFEGKTIDGYIEGAKVYLDQNFNFRLDDGELTSITTTDGSFNISTNDLDLYNCLKSRPIVADVPIGAIDSSLGEVTQAYRMVLPSINDTGNSAIVISPFTSLLGDAVVQAKSSSSIKDELTLAEGCSDVGNSIASSITSELNQIKNTLSSSLGISYDDLVIDFIADTSNSTITETSAQNIAKFFPYFKQLTDEFDSELSTIHNKTINTDVSIKKDSINAILADSAIAEIPVSFSAIYKTEPNDQGWFIQEKITAFGAKLNNTGEMNHYTCFNDLDNCTTSDISLVSLRDASQRYTRTSSFINNNYNPSTYNYQLVVEDEQRVDFDFDGNPSNRVCILQNWLYLTPVNQRENFTTNDRYNTGAADSSTSNDCASRLAGKDEALFVALVDYYDDGTYFEEIDVRINNSDYSESTFFSNKLNDVYNNRDNLNVDPLIQEIASIPRTFQALNILREKLSSTSTDTISIFWTKRNSARQITESAVISINHNPDNDGFDYITYKNSDTGSVGTVVIDSQGQQARNDLFSTINDRSSVFNNAEFNGSSAVTDERTSITGKTIDGYISGATVFFDVNFNQRLDAGEYSSITDENGTFEIKVNDSDLACIKARPIIANVPVGAEDSTLGTVTKEYQMLLPSVNDAGSNQIIISPFTSLIAEAILDGKSSSNLNEDLTVYEGCQPVGDNVASNISSSVQSLINNIETSFGITWNDLISDFIETGGSGKISESVAQKIANYFPYFKTITDEISSDLSAKYKKDVIPNVSLSNEALSSIFSEEAYTSLPFEFLSIYKTNPNNDGFYSIEEIKSDGSVISSSGVITRNRCVLDDSSKCDSTNLNLNTIGNASKNYIRDSAVYKDNFTIDGISGGFVIQGTERRGVRNSNQNYCESEEKIQFNGPPDTKGINMEYRYGFGRGAENIFDCSILSNYGPNLALRVEKQGNNIPSSGDRSPVWALQFNVLSMADTDLVENKVFNIVDNENINPETLIKEVATIPYKFSEIDEMRKLLKFGESAFYYYTPNSGNTGPTRPFCTTTIQVSSVPRDDQLSGSCSEEYNPNNVEYTPLVYSGENLFGQDARDKMYEILKSSEFDYDNMVGSSSPKSNVLFELEGEGITFYDRFSSSIDRDYKIFPRYNKISKWIDASLVGSEISKTSIDGFIGGNYSIDTYFSIALNADAPFTSTQDFKLQIFSNDNYLVNSEYLELIVKLKIETTSSGSIKVTWLKGDSVTFKLIDGDTQLTSSVTNLNQDISKEIPKGNYNFSDFNLFKNLLDKVRSKFSSSELEVIKNFFTNGQDYSYKIDLGGYTVLDDFDRTSSIIGGTFGINTNPSNSVYSYYQRFNEGIAKDICFYTPWAAEEDITFNIVPIYTNKPGFIKPSEGSFNSSNVTIVKGTSNKCVKYTAIVDDALQERQEFLHFDISNVFNAESGRNVPVTLTIEDM
jgi:hypothetical protein